MASPLKKFVGQTAIYGVSSILGRLLNYLLTPLYTSAAIFTTEQYGIITEMYSYVGFLVVFLMYGMETAFFRHYSSSENDKSRVYSTALWSVAGTSFIFISMVSFLQQPIADVLQYPDHSEYIAWFAIIVGLDALTAIPLARMRAMNKAARFAFVNLTFIAVNIGLNLFFLLYCKPAFQHGETNWLINTFYDPEIQVGYVFISNLIASLVRFLMVSTEFSQVKLVFDKRLWKSMLRYGFPLLIVGLAGITNEHLDKPLLKWILIPTMGKEAAMEQVGIYGGVYKLSIAITLVVQAYRYAAEPFFFDQRESKGSREVYARMLHLFTAFVLTGFLVIMLFMDILKHFLQNEKYWTGLDVVPLLLLANIFLGIYYNLSVWYKLTDRTMYGSYIAIGGALTTIVLNVSLIPVIGFRGSAWATFTCYFLMMVVSYIIGQRFYPVPYKLLRLVGYFALAIGIYFFHQQLPSDPAWLMNIVRVVLIAVFVGVVAYVEFLKPKTHAATG